MPRLIPIPDRVDALLAAIESLDEASFDRAICRDAFATRDRDIVAYRVFVAVTSNEKLFTYRKLEPVSSRLNWEEIVAGAARCSAALRRIAARRAAETAQGASRTAQQQPVPV